MPKNVQSLIWEDLVPSFIADAVVPRWWQVTPKELHAVALYQEFGEDLLTSAGKEASLRNQVVDILANCLLSRKLAELEAALDAGHPEEIIPGVTPAETFYLALEFRRKYPAEVTHWESRGGTSNGIGQNFVSSRYSPRVCELTIAPFSPSRRTPRSSSFAASAG